MPFVTPRSRANATCHAAVATFYDLTPGGGERYLLTFAAVMQRSGCVVDLIVLKAGRGVTRTCETKKCLYRTVQSLQIPQLKLSMPALRLFTNVHHAKGDILLPRNLYDVFYLMGNSRAPMVAGIGRFNIYQC